MAQIDLGVGRHRRQGLHVRLASRSSTCRPRSSPSPSPCGNSRRASTSPEFKGAGHRVVLHRAGATGTTVCCRTSDALLRDARLIERAHRLRHGALPSLRRAMAASPRRSSRWRSATASASTRRQHRRRTTCSRRPTAAFIVELADDAEFRPSARWSRSASWAPPPPSTRSAPAARRSPWPMLQEAWEHELEAVFPYRQGEDKRATVEAIDLRRAEAAARHARLRPSPSRAWSSRSSRATTASTTPPRAFERAGADADHTRSCNNLTPQRVAESHAGAGRATSTRARS